MADQQWHSFQPGDRVELSPQGLWNYSRLRSTTATVVGMSRKWPDSVMVVIDGTKTIQYFHVMYWQLPPPPPGSAAWLHGRAMASLIVRE